MVIVLLAAIVVALVVTLTLQTAVFRREEYGEMCQSVECVKTGTVSFRILSYRTILFRQIQGLSYFSFIPSFLRFSSLVVFFNDPLCNDRFSAPAMGK